MTRPTLWAEAAEEVRTAVRAHSGATLAVRSSSWAEDLADASHAGLYESVLDVRGEDSAVRAIETCLSSATGERLDAYSAASRASPLYPGRLRTPVALAPERCASARVRGFLSAGKRG